MTRLQEIDRRFPIRKTREQKDAFLKYALAEARGMGYAARIEENKGHRNLAVGDPETAEVIFSAHYDTAADHLLPSLLIPRNFPLFYLYQLFVILLLFVISFGAGYLVHLLGGGAPLPLIALILCYYALLMLLVAGPANRRNVNCNTSGVAVLMQLMERLPPEIRDQAAFLLFDDGERGRGGSRAYAVRHQSIKKSRMVVNLDCVGVGDHLLIAVKNFARAAFPYRFLLQCFPADGPLTPHFFPASACILNSDHQSFRCGITVAACKRRRLVGFYTPALHTRRDTGASQENIDYLTQSLADFVKTLAEN